MIRLYSKSIFKRTLLLLWIFWLAGVHLVFVGCAYQKTVEKTKKTVTKTTQKIRRNIRFSDDDLQRLAAVVGFENRAAYRFKDFAQLFRKGIPEYLNRECEDVTVPDLGSGRDVQQLNKVPRLKTGQVNNFAVATIGRKLGLNAVVTGALNDIGLISETEGLILKDRIHLIQILVSIEIFDTETGAKILDESFNRKVEIEGLDYDLMRSQEKLILPDLSETLRDLLSEMGEVICWAIEDQPWSGFVTALDGETVTLSSGSLSGLKPGDELEVFDISRTIKGRDGQKFFVHGKKIGEIKVVAVEADRSRAAVVSDEGIKAGSSVHVK